MPGNSWAVFLLLQSCIYCVSTQYQPNWESLDTRYLPEWYDEAKIGIFIHWGVFSVPSFGSEWFWEQWQVRKILQDTVEPVPLTAARKENVCAVNCRTCDSSYIDDVLGSKLKPYVDFMKQNYPPDFTYADFAADFTAEFFDPYEWADIFNASGAKYVVLTSKHHEGYCLWPSKYAFSWNSMDVGPKRDIVGELAAAIRNKTSIKFGLYHSLYEWFNPLYLEDKENGFNTQYFVKGKTMAELYELVNTYYPEVVWSDGDWEADDTYWSSTEFLAWLYNSSPVNDTVVVNDRWGSGIMCHHGDFYTCSDRYNPGVLQKHKWENCMTIDKKSWGYRRNAPLADFLTTGELIQTLAETVSCGGNLLMNVGPAKDGHISPIFEERLRDMGKWLSINGEAIYGSKPWTKQNDTLTSGVWYTSKMNNNRMLSVYAIVLQWPKGDVLQLGDPKPKDAKSEITLLGHPKILGWKISSNVLHVVFPPMPEVSSNWAWVVKINGIQH